MAIRARRMAIDPTRRTDARVTTTTTRTTTSARAGAVVSLIVATPVLAEILSGNTPVCSLLAPKVVLLLLLAYGLPVLVARELGVRASLDLVGRILVGLAYGVLNEGTLAQTLFRPDHLPVAVFDRYLFVDGVGVGVAWAILIVPWHAFLSIVFPIALVEVAFPNVARTPWIGRRTFIALAIVTIVAILFVTLVRPPRAQMWGCFVVMASLIGVACVRRRRDDAEAWTNERRRLRSFASGVALQLVLFFVPVALAIVRAPAIVFFAIVATAWTILAVLFRRARVLVLPARADCALGAYLTLALFTLIVAVTRHSMQTIIATTTLAVPLVWLALRSRDSRSAGAGAAAAGGADDRCEGDREAGGDDRVRR
jgi:hypothetical protein